jgi:hypothetical protein
MHGTHNVKEREVLKNIPFVPLLLVAFHIVKNVSCWDLQ